MPFSASPYYDYLDNFLIGLKLETMLPKSTNCIDHLVYTLDDYAYFQNNITLHTTWEEPMMNFTNAIGGNFSYVPHDCWAFMVQMYKHSRGKYKSFPTIGDFFLAFLFNMMGNALAFNNAIAQINSNNAN